MNSYEDIKKFILIKLQNVNGVLSKDEIYKEVKNTRELSQLGNEVFAKILSVSYVEVLSDKEWEKMTNELEEHFDVEMEEGTIIQGNEQQKRDTKWWTSKEKQQGENYYWNRYKEYIGKELPPEVVRTIDVDTDNVMDNIGNIECEYFSIYGMVVGHVQSGKTSNYASLICKAADAGYKFIVVIAGGINNLRNQTQERINEAFVGKDETGLVGVGKLGDVRNELQPVSLTTTKLDFNKQDAEKNSTSVNFDNINSPIVLVIKKNTSTLTNVITWLESQYNKRKIGNHAMLLIDDESDYASVNTKEEENPTTINFKIRKLLNLFKKSTYIAYTATPYANIFIDHKVDDDNWGKDLFPRDFIYSLAAPSNYFGARKIFLDTDRKYLKKISDYETYIPLKHKKDMYLKDIPNSLYDAMRLFIINIGVRCLRNQQNKHNSMLIHATRFTRVHQQIASFVEAYVAKIRTELDAYGALEDALNHSKIIKDIKETYDSEYHELEFNWQQVLDSICNIIDTVVVREVHQGSTVPLEYRDDEVTNAIVVGGTSVARGFTLEGLSVSYFLRNTVFYDTLMQMGRWFGYRPGYEDLCKIYMTEDMMDNFALIIEATEDLVDTFKIMNEQHRTPKDFGLAVRQHPNSILQVTARNKQKNAKDLYFEMNLDGNLKETSWLSSDVDSRNNNLKTIKDTVIKLQANGILYSKVGNHHLWKDVDKNIIAEFIDKFKIYSSDPFGLKSRMPIDFIKKYVNDIDTKWDVALYSGESKSKYTIGNISIQKEKRQIKNCNNYYEIKNRQISSGNSEGIGLHENERKLLGNKRKDIRFKMKKPLLMLHVLQTELDEKIDELAAFGVSFPGCIKSQNDNVVLKVNSVYVEYINRLLEEEEFDD